MAEHDGNLLPKHRRWILGVFGQLNQLGGQFCVCFRNPRQLFDFLKRHLGEFSFGNFPQKWQPIET